MALCARDCPGLPLLSQIHFECPFHPQTLVFWMNSVQDHRLYGLQGLLLPLLLLSFIPLF